MSPWMSNHALVAYMLVGVPMTVWAGEMLVRAVERRIRERAMRRRASMRRHPAGSRVTGDPLGDPYGVHNVSPGLRRSLDREYARLERHAQRETPAARPAYGECTRCGAPVWVPSVHAANCPVQPLRAGRWS